MYTAWGKMGDGLSETRSFTNFSTTTLAPCVNEIMCHRARARAMWPILLSSSVIVVIVGRETVDRALFDVRCSVDGMLFYDDVDDVVTTTTVGRRRPTRGGERYLQRRPKRVKTKTKNEEEKA